MYNPFVHIYKVHLLHILAALYADWTHSAKTASAGMQHAAAAHTSQTGRMEMIGLQV